MAEIKLPTVSYKDIGEKGARYALDEVEYKGLTIRQWADKITGGEYAPVVHAYWQDRTGQDLYCSNCGFSYEREQGGSAQITDYCGNCGAKMDEEEHDNNV